MKRSIALIALAAMGCDDFDPTGVYVGEATRSGESGEMVTYDPAMGRGTRSSASFNQTASGVHATVTRAGERKLDMRLGEFCRVRVEMGSGPDREGVVELDQRCRVDEQYFTGDALVTGTVTFDSGDEGGINVDLTGSGQQGDIDAPGLRDVSFSYAFHGERAP